MHKLKSLLSKLGSFFQSGQAEAAFETVLRLAPKAVPIVQAISAMTENKEDDQIALAFAKYGQPFSAEYLAAPKDQRGYLLLHLASSVLAAEAPGVATNILNCAVQVAFTGTRKPENQS